MLKYSIICGLCANLFTDRILKQSQKTLFVWRKWVWTWRWLSIVIIRQRTKRSLLEYWTSPHLYKLWRPDWIHAVPMEVRVNWLVCLLIHYASCVDWWSNYRYANVSRICCRFLSCCIRLARQTWSWQHSVFVAANHSNLTRPPSHTDGSVVFARACQCAPSWHLQCTTSASAESLLI